MNWADRLPETRNMRFEVTEKVWQNGWLRQEKARVYRTPVKGHSQVTLAHTTSKVWATKGGIYYRSPMDTDG